MLGNRNIFQPYNPPYPQGPGDLVCQVALQPTGKPDGCSLTRSLLWTSKVRNAPTSVWLSFLNWEGSPQGCEVKKVWSEVMDKCAECKPILPTAENKGNGVTKDEGWSTSTWTCLWCWRRDSRTEWPSDTRWARQRAPSPPLLASTPPPARVDTITQANTAVHCNTLAPASPDPLLNLSWYMWSPSPDSASPPDPYYSNLLQLALPSLYENRYF